MKIDKALRVRLATLFDPLNRMSASQAFPTPTSLAKALEVLVPTDESQDVFVKPQIASLFVTAAVEIWLRAVHSFLISASLTETSPIWASASGYYSSHYSVRAFAHLLGYFQLYKAKRIVQVGLHDGKLICSFYKKNASDREHQFYWKVVKRDPHFAADPLFTLNDSNPDASDAGHRERANYGDHICLFPKFKPLDLGTMQIRVQTISGIEFTVPPIPRRSNFPDVEAVQVIAYHRIVRFRQFLDEILGGGNRFWTIHRKPAWTGDIIDFQLTEQRGLGLIAN